MEKEKVSHALVAGGPNRRSVSESRGRGGMQLTDKSMIKSETNRCYRADKKKKEKKNHIWPESSKSRCRRKNICQIQTQISGKQTKFDLMGVQALSSP
jgi:hypothetical protein